MPNFKVIAEGSHFDEFSVESDTGDEALTLITGKTPPPASKVKFISKKEKWTFTVYDGDTIVRKIEVEH